MSKWDECKSHVEKRQVYLAAAAIVLAALAAYADSFAGVMVYDDIPSIRNNRTIRHLWPISDPLSPPADGDTISGRPLLNLSLALNYAVGQTSVWGYHAVNLAIHISAALLLFGIVRRTLLLLTKEQRPSDDRAGVPPGATNGLDENRAAGESARLLAFSIALLWAVHPLQTESVTYIVQRAESLAGCFYLLTLYCAIRGSTDGKPSAPWQVGAVLACLLGMATKEVVATAPLLVLLYDRTFLAGSFGGAIRRHWGLYAGLAATWGLLGYLVISTRLLFCGAEFSLPGRWSYACTQPGVILHYLRLSVWPHPLCIDYEWPLAQSMKDVLAPAIVVGCLLAVTLWGLIRNRAYGFLGAWFFLILAPTSSFIPLGQAAFEHRVYLSLAAVVTAIVMCGYALGLAVLRRGAVSARTLAAIGGCLVVAATLTLGYLTYQRNGDYRSDLALWQDTVSKSPRNDRAHNNLGNALDDRGRFDEAVAQYTTALAIKPDNAKAHYNLGLALAKHGRPAEAIESFQAALRLAVAVNDRRSAELIRAQIRKCQKGASGAVIRRKTPLESRL